MQNQDSIEKAFIQQLKVGDYVDARYGQDQWKLAKILQKQHKYLSLVFDGYPPNPQQTYLTTMRIKPLRSVTLGYTGPQKNIYINMMVPVVELGKYIQLLDTILKNVQMSSPYKITQFIRGELFANISMLLMAEVKVQGEEIGVLNSFFVGFGERVGRICCKIKQYLPQYLQSNINNKLSYLTNSKLSLLYSLHELLYLINISLSQGADQPRLFKMYKSQLSQQNIYQNIKQYLNVFYELLSVNDVSGRWMPTNIRLLLSKILIKYKDEEKIYKIQYGIKDYLEFYLYWPCLLASGTGNVEANQRKFVQYVVNVISKQSTFDSKLKSLQILRKLLQKQQKLSQIQLSQIIELLSQKKVVDSLLKYFNPQIFKRYIPILKLVSNIKKSSSSSLTLTQTQIDLLFKILQNSHQSQTNILYQIIVSISEFINIETLDNIYMDIQKNIDINSEHGIKFIKQFTIKAINNYNSTKSKSFFSSILNRKKSSPKFNYYGLNLFTKQILDNTGKIAPINIPITITNIGKILQNQSFHSQRMNYMQACITNIDKRQSYGQSVKLLAEIVCTYPITAYIGDSQESVVAKLDQKYKLVDCLIKGLKPLQLHQQQLLSKNTNTPQLKVCFDQSIKYCYSFLQQFNPYLKNQLQLRHINHLWQLPHIFQFLRKSRQNLDSQIPSWKKKYYKKLSEQLIKGIILQIISKQENILLNQECFDAIHQLILAYNLNKNIELTERATIRYRNINIIGVGFYGRVLDKIVKEKDKAKYVKLLDKVVKTIFQIHMRPVQYYAIQSKCQNWIKCLMKVIKTIHKEYPQSCITAIETFLQMIKGRQSKDITNANGKLDIVVCHQSRQKTITLPKNSTILKLRTSIMQVFKIKYNFDMFNTHLKRQIKYVEEEDFSIYAMGQAIKGPTIIVKRVQDKELYPQFQAYDRFMSMIEGEAEFYKVVFGVLQKEADLGSRIWKIIDKVPVNRVTKEKIKNCKDFIKKNWEEFLLPHRMQQLQYSINIVYSLLGSSSWLEDFKKTEGNVVVEELYLTMLASNEPLSQKIKINLSKILLKMLQHNSSSCQQSKKQSNPPLCLSQSQNTRKITKKIMQFFQRLTQSNQTQTQISKQTNSSNIPSTQCINLMLKMLLTSSFKRNQPQLELLIKFFIHDQIMLYLSDLILFKFKDVDTTFFTEDILEKIIFQTALPNNEKFQIFNKFLQKYLKYDILVTKDSTENYFVFLIDFLHGFQKDDSKKLFEANPDMVHIIKQYVYRTLDCERINQNGEITENKKNLTTDQMLHGCLKLLHDTLFYPCFAYDFEKIFNVFLTDFVLLQSMPKLKSEQSSNSNKNSKNKLKYRKILYQIMKIMIYNKEQILNIFVERVAPKLQTAQWRRNLFSSWNLQQQKKQKKFFCGLQNLAATCYINCLFQQIFMIRNFTDRFINIDSIAYKEQPETNQIYQLQKLLTFLKYGNKRSYTTRQFCQSFITYEGVPIDPTVQNDADQFFNALMEKIQTFLKLAGQHHILQQTFEGKLSNQLNCEGCPHSSQKIQPFLSIGLDIKNKKTLESALDGYVEGEILDGDNAYFCQKCQKKVRTMKKLCIKQLPNILVIVLKRFTYNYDEMRKIKVNDQLKFPQNLNMKKYMSEFHSEMEMENEMKQIDQKKQNDDYFQYHLRGVVVHSGTSEGGHYFSFIKEEQQGKWYQFNDEYIDEADYKRVEEDGFGGEQKDSQFKLQKHKSAYILFYQKQQPQKIPCQLQPQEPFQSQLRQLVQSQNRTADFLSIILDQSFIRLCQNIGMCGKKNAHYFLILYFHSVLIRDKNRDEYLSNIYRILLTLFSQDLELTFWFLKQVDQGYIREFLIQAQKVSRYLCLGLVLHAVRIVKDAGKGKGIKKQKQVKAKIQPIENNKQKQITVKTVKIQQKIENQEQIKQKQQKQQQQQQKQSISQKSQQPNSQQPNSQQTKPKQPKSSQLSPKQPTTQLDKNPQQTINPPSTQQTSEQKQQYNSKQKQNNKSIELVEEKITQKQSEQQAKMQQIKSNVELNQLKNNQNVLKEQKIEEEKVQESGNFQKYNRVVLELIPRLVAAVKSKGMCPFAKIFTYLGSIPAYREQLQKYQYSERVAQIVTNSNNKLFSKIQYPSPEQSYLGHQHQSTKQKDLQQSHTFLLQSLRYFPHSLSLQYIHSQLSQSPPLSRPATKSLIYLLTKQTQSAQLAVQTIQSFKNVLMDDKYKKEDVEKFMFIIRYYYLMCDGLQKKLKEANKQAKGDAKQDAKQSDSDQFVDSVKGMCIGSVAIVIKSNQGTYLAMEIIIPELNKLAYKCQDFKNRWIQKVSQNESLYKSLTYWLAQSKRPHFLHRNQQWKRKTTNLSYQQKQQITSQNIKLQQQRTLWMLSSSTRFQKSKKDESNLLEKQIEIEKQARVSQIHSELDFTQIGKNIVVGFKMFKIVDRLGVLTKVEDQKGMHRWALLQRNQIETYIDF